MIEKKVKDLQVGDVISFLLCTNSNLVKGKVIRINGRDDWCVGLTIQFLPDGREENLYFRTIGSVNVEDETDELVQDQS